MAGAEGAAAAAAAKAVSRIQAFSREFSFGAFLDADDMAYFLKCHAPRPGSALTQV